MVNWEQRYREEDTPWEKGAGAPPLRAWLARNRVLGKVLVPGCGTGHDVRLLASQGADVLGLDVAKSAIMRAQSFPVAGGEHYQLGDFLQLSKALWGKFDWIFEHTCYCAIDPSQREAYREGVLRALKPGGILLGLFYPYTGNPPGEGPPYPTTLEELDTRFSSDFYLVRRWIPSVGYPGRIPNEEFRILQRKK